jgi:hypothetical protein
MKFPHTLICVGVFVLYIFNNLLLLFDEGDFRIIPARDDGGLGGKVLLVYETIKIYSEKFITNNSENNQKLSYTHKHTN